MSGRGSWWHDGAARIAYKAAAKEALTRGAGFILSLSNVIVPFDEGILAGSGFVDVDADQGEATVSYDTPYAVRLHENPQYDFQNGRKGKWLESTMNEHGAEAQDLMAKVVKGRVP